LLARLRQKGIDIKVREGSALSDHYTTGASASNHNVQHNKGQMHTKLLICDNQMAIGSTNFTTSAQCNLETAAIIALSAEGRSKMSAQFVQDSQDAEDY
jgi:phosphatidylserine/phosphatidylglycerophosphate/cardiolipin synthase-like enzyme